MRRLFFMLFCLLTGLSGPGRAFSQEQVFPTGVPTAPAAKPSEGKAGSTEKKGTPVSAKLGEFGGDVPDYQKDNPMLKTNLNKTSDFQGKMFETKEFSTKQFSGGKDQPVVLNKMFVQDSAMASGKSDWQNKESPLKKSDLNNQQSDFINKKTGFEGAEVPLKMAKDHDAKTEDAKKAAGFSQLLSEGQKRYDGPESPNSASELELIQERLKKANSPEELKKNQLTTDEVKKLLEPQAPLTRPR